MRKQNLSLYSKLAIEELEEQATVVGEEPVVEIEAGADSVEADLIDINEDVVEAQDNEDTAEEAGDVIEELEVAAEALKVIASNGGLDRNGAIGFDLLRTSLLRRIDAEVSAPSVSTESFGSVMSKTDATKLAMEDFKTAAADAWKKLVEFFKRIAEHIKALWNKVFDGATKLKARAEKAIKAADDLKSAGDPKAKTFESPKLAEATSLGGKVNAKSAADALKTISEQLTGHMQSAKKAADDALAAVKTGKLDDLSFTVPSGFKSVDPAKVGMAAPDDGMAIYSNDKELPGNKALVLIAPNADAGPLKSPGKISVKIGAFDASKKLPEKIEIATQPPSDASETAKSILAVAEAVLKYKAPQAELEKIRSAIISEAQAQVSKGDKAAEGATAGNKSNAKQSAQAAMAYAGLFGPVISAQLLNTGTSVIQLVEQSLKQYGAAKAAAPAAEAPAAAA